MIFDHVTYSFDIRFLSIDMINEGNPVIIHCKGKTTDGRWVQQFEIWIDFSNQSRKLVVLMALREAQSHKNNKEFFSYFKLLHWVVATSVDSQDNFVLYESGTGKQSTYSPDQLLRRHKVFAINK